MHINIRSTMQQAMFDSVSQALDAEDSLANETSEWLIRLFEELRDRLAGLTPNRKDIHEKLHASLDGKLFRQMITHDALDEGDWNHIVQTVFVHIEGLCAPSQDADVRQKRANMNEAFATLTRGKAIASFLRDVHEVIDEIERLTRAFLRPEHS